MSEFTFLGHIGNENWRRLVREVTMEHTHGTAISEEMQWLIVAARYIDLDLREIALRNGLSDPYKYGPHPSICR